MRYFSSSSWRGPGNQTLLLGALVALAPWQLSLAGFCDIATSAALTHGYANGQAMRPDTRTVLSVAHWLAIAA